MGTWYLEHISLSLLNQHPNTCMCYFKEKFEMKKLDNYAKNIIVGRVESK